MRKVLFDTNIVVDILLAREPFAQQSLALLKLAENKFIKGYISASSISDIHYIVLKSLKDESKTMEGIDTILEILKVAKISQKIICRARQLNWNDFEDAIQNECAACNHLKYIVTRNVKDFKNSTLNVMTPEEFLKNY